MSPKLVLISRARECPTCREPLLRGEDMFCGQCSDEQERRRQSRQRKWEREQQEREQEEEQERKHQEQKRKLQETGKILR